MSDNVEQISKLFQARFKAKLQTLPTGKSANCFSDEHSKSILCAISINSLCAYWGNNGADIGVFIGKEAVEWLILKGTVPRVLAMKAGAYMKETGIIREVYGKSKKFTPDSKHMYMFSEFADGSADFMVMKMNDMSFSSKELEEVAALDDSLSPHEFVETQNVEHMSMCEGCGELSSSTMYECKGCRARAHEGCLESIDPKCSHYYSRMSVSTADSAVDSDDINSDSEETSGERVSSFVYQPPEGEASSELKFEAESKPAVVFVNGKSGGQTGKKYLEKFKSKLHPLQVYDLTEEGPYNGLMEFKSVPNHFVVACGGDGTVGWILQTIDKIDYEGNPPPVAVVPLGTGNDLSRVLGWGSTPPTGSLTKRLETISKSEIALMDRWNIHIIENSALSIDNSSKSFAMNNYMSIGVDAKIALMFHEKREQDPTHFKSQAMNKFWYVKFSAQALFTKKEKFKQNVKIYVDGKEIKIPSEVEAVIIQNIPSYASGANIWGGMKEDGFRYQSFGDKHFEVVGIKGLSHMGRIQVHLASGIRLAQGASAKIMILPESGMPMQVDGEPWLQKSALIEVSHLNQAHMIINSTASGMGMVVPGRYLVDDLFNFTDEEIGELTLEFVRGVKRHERKKAGIRTFKEVFIGAEAVDWLMFRLKTEDRICAVKVGQKLMDTGLFVEVKKKKVLFQDANIYYRFRLYDERKLSNPFGSKKTRTESPQSSSRRAFLAAQEEVEFVNEDGIIKRDGKSRPRASNVLVNKLTEAEAKDILITAAERHPAVFQLIDEKLRKRHQSDAFKAIDEQLENFESESIQTPSFVGHLSITLISGSNLKGDDNISPYVLCHCEHETLKAKAEKGGKNPVFGEQFHFVVMRSNSLITFTVMDKSTAGKLVGRSDKLVGKLSIPMSTLQPGTRVDRSYSIARRKPDKKLDTAVSTIRLVIEYSFMNGTYDTGVCLGPEPFEMPGDPTGGFKGLITSVSEANHSCCLFDNVFLVKDKSLQGMTSRANSEEDLLDDEESVMVNSMNLISGYFEYFTVPMSKEQVEVFIRPGTTTYEDEEGITRASDWISIGVHLTTEGGRITAEVPKWVIHTPGHYMVRMVVLHDHSMAQGSIFVVEKGTGAVVFDVDGTLTVGDQEVVAQAVKDAVHMTHDVKLRRGAVSLVRAWAAKGYLPLYLSGRAGSFYNLTRDWLIRHGFPPGTIHHTKNHMPTLPLYSSVGIFKLNYIKDLRTRGLDVSVAYGNTLVDFRVYKEANIAHDKIFSIGPHAGKMETVVAGKKNYMAHLSEVFTYPDAPIPAPNKFLDW
eukprot:Nk52_evm1s223 gene=Nk52_evmTU1s223